MMLFAALLFGFVAGLRTFTGEAVYFGLRGGIAGIVFPLFALGEYVADALPQIPARTTIGPVLVRCASGAFMGWTVARVGGAAAGVVGALLLALAGWGIRNAVKQRRAAKRYAKLLGYNSSSNPS